MRAVVLTLTSFLPDWTRSNLTSSDEETKWVCSSLPISSQRGINSSVKLVWAQRKGWNLEILWRWEKAVHGMWDLNDNVLSKITPRFLTSVAVGTKQPSIRIMRGEIWRALIWIKWEELHFYFNWVQACYFICNGLQAVRKAVGDDVTGNVTFSGDLSNHWRNSEVDTKMTENIAKTEDIDNKE